MRSQEVKILVLVIGVQLLPWPSMLLTVINNILIIGLAVKYLFKFNPSEAGIMNQGSTETVAKEVRFAEETSTTTTTTKTPKVETKAEQKETRQRKMTCPVADTFVLQSQVKQQRVESSSSSSSDYRLVR